MRAAGSFSEDEIARASVMMEAMLGPQPICPVRGGYIRALDDATGRELWRLMIYENGEGDGSSSNREDVVVTSLAIEGEHLVARDAERRIHRVDLRSRQVIESFVDTTPTPLDLAQAALRASPAPRRARLFELISAVKACMDRDNIASAMSRFTGGRPPVKRDVDVTKALEQMADMPLDDPAHRAALEGLAGQLREHMSTLMGDLQQAMGDAHEARFDGGPAPDLDRDLALLLDELGAIADGHPLIGEARQAGLRMQARIADGEGIEILWAWFQGELSWIHHELLVEHWR